MTKLQLRQSVRYVPRPYSRARHVGILVAIGAMSIAVLALGFIAAATI